MDPQTNEQTTSTSEPEYVQCGAGGLHQLDVRFDPASIRLQIDRGYVELLDGMWSYGFTEDGQLQVRMASRIPMGGAYRDVGSAEFSPLTQVEGGLELLLARPVEELHDVQVVLWQLDTTTTSTTPAEPGRPPGTPPETPSPPELPTRTPMGPQPTLIIRTKKSCPTGGVQSMLG